MTARISRGRAAGAVLALLALLALVAYASRGHGAVGADPGSSRPLGGLLDAAGTLALVLLAFGTVLVVYVLVAGRGERLPGRRPSPGRGLLPLAVLVGLIGLLHATGALHSLEDALRSIGPGGTQSAGTHATHPRPAPAASTPGDSGFAWLPALALAGVLAALAAAALLRMHSRPAGAERQDSAHELTAAIDDALARLEVDGDARTAVIACYARMERVLAQHGLERRASEAPLEYLSRVLQELEAGEEPARRLTALFERARFSSHDVSTQMRADAVRSLREVRDGLQGAA